MKTYYLYVLCTMRAQLFCGLIRVPLHCGLGPPILSEQDHQFLYSSGFYIRSVQINEISLVAAETT